VIIRHVPFLDVFADASGGNVKTPQAEYQKSGQFPVIDQGKSLVAGYVDDESRLCGSGQSAIVFGDHTRCVKYTDFPFCMGADGVKILRPKVEADLKYLYYYLRQLNLPDAGYSRHFKYLKRVKVVLLPFPEQRRIAAILDQADSLRAKRREALSQLDSLTQSIFIEMFGDPIINPKRWKRCTVGEVTDCIVPGRDKPKSFTGDIPWVTTDDLVHLGFTHHSPKGLGLSATEISEVKARIIPAGSVIISCVGNLGITTIATADMVMNQQLHSFQCHNQVNNIYLMHCLAKQTAFMYAKASSTTLPYMNKSVCNSIPVQIPPVELQNTFADRFLAINRIKKQHQVFLADLDTLFASLQHRAFRGEL
jgi:type I restriction enzyme S subunit